MSWQTLMGALLLIVLLGVTAIPLGRYMAKVYGGGKAPGDRFFDPIDRAIYRVCGINAKREQRWNVYAISLLAFSLVSVLVVYAIQRLQGWLPFNPTDKGAVPPETGAAACNIKHAEIPVRPGPGLWSGFLLKPERCGQNKKVG